MCYKLCFQIYCFIVVLWWNVAVSYKKHRYFKAGGVGKLLNAKKRTIYVERGQEARLRWEFTIDETTEFHGIYWKFLNSTRHELRLISMDVTENQHQLLDVQNRIEYKVHLEEQATLVIPNVQFIHENTYFCYVPRTGLYSSIESQIQLIVTVLNAAEAMFHFNLVLLFGSKRLPVFLLSVLIAYCLHFL